MTVDARIGTTLQGKYAIERVLGEGGMGIVYAARHVRLDRPVAIKFLHAPYARDRAALARFESEARAAGSLRHPNVVDVVDVDVEATSGAPFMVLELLSGEPLSSLLQRRGALPADEALALLDPVLDALEAAHARGIVHRDLKPDNIFLAQEAGRVVPKLLDFGIAKLRDSSPDAATATGTAMGTPTYMAPEQARGSVREIGPWTDVWSMGVVLFECTSGRMHFDFAPDAGVLGWLGQVATGRPRALRDAAPGVPETFASAVDAALDVEPARRTQSVAALRAALRGEAAGAEVVRTVPAPATYFAGVHVTPETRSIPTPVVGRGPMLARVAAVGLLAATLLAGAIAIGVTAWQEARREEVPAGIAAAAREPRAETATETETAAGTETAAATETVTETTEAETTGAEAEAVRPVPRARERGALVGGDVERPARDETRERSDPARDESAERGEPAGSEPERSARTRSGEWRVDDL